MPDYNNSKIYKIEPINSLDDSDVYIGKTTKKYLCQRKEEHKGKYNAWKNGDIRYYYTSFIIFEKYGFDNCQITLIETVNANNKDELRLREAHYIKTISCVNKVQVGRTQKEYYIDNKDYILNLNKQYRVDHKVDIHDQKKLYRESHQEQIIQARIDNKDLLKYQSEQWRINNQDKIIANRIRDADKIKEKHNCEICGGKYTTSAKARHMKCPKHLNACVIIENLI